MKKPRFHNLRYFTGTVYFIGYNRVRKGPGKSKVRVVQYKETPPSLPRLAMLLSPFANLKIKTVNPFVRNLGTKMSEEVKVENVKETDEFAIPGLDPEATVEKGADPTTEDDNCSGGACKI
ncbi:hypothetical protein GAP86_18515 [Salmonella enterica]|nr:hypothetical protein [Salmonella enterica]